MKSISFYCIYSVTDHPAAPKYSDHIWCLNLLMLVQTWACRFKCIYYLFDLSDLCHKSLYQDEGVEVIVAVLKRKRSILIRKLHKKRSSRSYIIDTKESVMLSKMLFNTVHLIVQTVHLIFYWQRLLFNYVLLSFVGFARHQSKTWLTVSSTHVNRCWLSCFSRVEATLV